MEWIQLSSDMWQAKGEDGEFLLWKSGRQWTGHYAANKKDGKFFKLPYGSLKSIKAKCENNYYWEAKVS